MVIHRTIDLGRLIRMRREEAGLTLLKTAQLAGVSRRLLAELELGKRHQVALSAVLRILEILGLRIDVERRAGKMNHV
jgi:transcriptional regulator with XRE-family HTH domain